VEIVKIDKKTLSVLLIAAVVLALFSPVVGFDFLMYDDEQYVTKNPVVMGGLTPGGVKWAFTSLEAGFWQPLVWLSHMTDVELFGMDPHGHHLANLILHLANSVLLFLIFTSMTNKTGSSLFLSLLFAVHPLHVETVAWVADRKDLLCAFFWFSTTAAYVAYARRPAWRTYLLVLFFFSLGLMTKPMIVTLPLVLLVLDFWPLGRFPRTVTTGEGKFRRLVAEKIPLAILAVPVVFLTFAAETRAGALSGVEWVSFAAPLGDAAVNYVAYIIKTFLPSDLAVFYPLKRPSPWQVLLSVLFLGAVTSMILYHHERYPFAVTGWLWYLFSLVPVSGIVRVGSHGLADRYTYIPLIGLFIMAAWGGGRLSRETPGGRWGVTMAFFCVFVMSWTSWEQVQTWRNTETVFNHALAVTEGNWLAHGNLGVWLLEKGRAEDAVFHFQEAIRINPHYRTGRLNLANALVTLGRIDEGIELYRVILKESPRDVSALRNLADALMKKGARGEAMAVYRTLLGIDPNDPDVINNLGVALYLEGSREEGVSYIRRALSLRPDHREALDNLKKIEKLSRDGR